MKIFIFSGGFLGDIALPNIEYEKELQYEKVSLQREIEKYKQEVLEGLQIEEEGLNQYIRKKIKQPSIFVTQRTYNDPIDNAGVIDEANKKSQRLKQYKLQKLDNNNNNKTKNNASNYTDDVQERLIKTQSNSREIYEGVKHNIMNETETTTTTTVTEGVKLRHNRRNVDGNNKNRNRHGRKRRRRKQQKNKQDNNK